MVASHHREVFGHLIRVVEEQRIGVRPGVHRETAGDVERHVPGQVAVDVRADIPRREKLVLVIVDLDLVHGEPQGVHH